MPQSKQTPQTALALANMVGQIGCVTTIASMVIIGLAFVVGNYLDNLLGTRPVFIFLALLGSFPVTLFVIVRISLLAVARAQALQERVEAEQEQFKKDKDSL